MLDTLRQGARTWVAKLLLILLILSFAVWGISDQILGRAGGDVVLESGDTAVTVQQYRLAYDRQLALESQRLGTRLTREQARLLGVDNAVQARMVGSVVLDEQARVMGLGLSEDRLAGLIAEDPAFQGLDGRFDRSQFRFVLNQVGMSEADYIVDREKAAIRQQVVEAVSDGITVPETFLDALHRYQGQTRDIAFVEIGAGAIDPVGEPTDQELQAYFEDNAERYRAPEYRSIRYVLLTPETIADPATVSDATVRAEYQDNQARYAVAEQRTIQQLVFSDRQQAEAVRERIDAGADFETIAAEMGRSVADITLGTFTEDDAPGAVGDAAFALDRPGAVSDVVEGPFGPVLVRVSEIIPGQTRPFEEVSAEIRSELALLEARDILLDIHDDYEDARAAGATMAEAAERVRLNVQTVDAIDRQGQDEQGAAVTDLPERRALLEAAFETEIGQESRPLNAGREGFLWYEVTDIEPDRARTLEEVRARVIEDWRADRTQAALDEQAGSVADRLRDGADPAAIAEADGYRADSKFGLSRTGTDADIGDAALAEIFTAGPGEVGVAPGASDSRRIVFRIEQISDPVGGADQLDDRLPQAVSGSLADDLLNQMVNRLQQEFPVTLNRSALERALSPGN
ncbi:MULTISPECIES: peptidyl-prolyl cis-trans isomerase [unclassified Roseitalea]|uniref:peptidyl-prolyl cis-trans isomerase n=1 Tax=unclassified Roseitalea TaxID=2639107 RepID=UPI00273D5E2B|nr:MULTISPECIES: peptidyl-prolyl cis-trans isomerase [unclassified Roseitalea]